MPNSSYSIFHNYLMINEWNWQFWVLLVANSMVLQHLIINCLKMYTTITSKITALWDESSFRSSLHSTQITNHFILFFSVWWNLQGCIRWVFKHPWMVLSSTENSAYITHTSIFLMVVPLFLLFINCYLFC